MGHDLRPDYLWLGAVVEALGHPTILALTAWLFCHGRASQTEPLPNLGQMPYVRPFLSHQGGV